MKKLFQKTWPILIAGVSIAGVILMFFHEAYDHSLLRRNDENFELSIDRGQVSKLIINRDTTRRIYLVNDTVTNMIWIGIGGKIVTKHK